jgi:hypothetical protein
MAECLAHLVGTVRATVNEDELLAFAPQLGDVVTNGIVVDAFTAANFNNDHGTSPKIYPQISQITQIFFF